MRYSRVLGSANLLCGLMQRGAVVIDKHGAWMSSLKSDIERLNVDVMRMPVNIHPSPKPLALKYYAEKHGRTEVSR